ncbi:MAG: heme biosynthesis HemY N-terminal domain-containing protein [Xanthomonadales bacterium]|nr:heme biosynthesis HemY N-terminal domain-containing protein [Xanthomonadales bacterium]
MKWLGFLLLTGAVTLAAIWAVPYLPGYVLVRIGGWTLETGVVWLLLAILLVYLVIHGAVWAWRLPGNAARKYLEKRSRAQLELGMLALAEGDWRKAEKALTKSAKRSKTPAVSYIAAAQAAHGPGADTRRDEYLQKAEQNADAQQSVAVTRAQLLLGEDQPEEALALLREIPNLRNRPRALDLVAQCHEQMDQWSELTALSPDLVRHGIIDTEQADRIADQGIRQRLDTAIGFDELQGVWQSLPRAQRRRPEFVERYARAALSMGHDTEVEQLVRSTLDREWSDALCLLYGKIAGAGASARLKAAEKWLKKHEGNSALHLTLGRLCLQSEIWGKAREHLEKSISLAETPEAFRTLGRLHERLEEKELAIRAYRRAVELFAAQGESAQ